MGLFRQKLEKAIFNWHLPVLGRTQSFACLSMHFTMNVLTLTTTLISLVLITRPVVSNIFIAVTGVGS